MTVANVSVGEAGLIQVETSAPHGKSTGQQVYLAGIQGISGANGLFTITVVTETTFTLDGSNGSGAYVSETGWMGDSSLISSAWLLYQGAAPAQNTVGGCFRVSTVAQGGTGYAWNDYRQICCVNQYAWATGSASPQVGGVRIPATTSGRTYMGSRYVLFEPLLSWGRALDLQGNEIVGQLWDAVMTNNGVSLDLEATFDGHNWHNFMNATNASFVATPICSLWLVIP